jgi:hypothetical protein
MTREDCLAEATEIGAALTREYEPIVAAALRNGDMRQLEIVRLRFETDYRRQVNHLVYQLASMGPER